MMDDSINPPALFTAEDFKATPSCVAEAKAIIANRLVTFIESGCQRKLFTRGTYRTLIESFGFERCGRQQCYQRHFWDLKRQSQSLRRLADHVPIDDRTNGTSDVQYAIVAWVRKVVLPANEQNG